MTTMRGVVISEAGETIASRVATYEPENLIRAITDLTAGLREAGDIRSGRPGDSGSGQSRNGSRPVFDRDFLYGPGSYSR